MAYRRGMERITEVLGLPVVAVALRVAFVIVVGLLVTRGLRRVVRKVEAKVAEDTTPLRALQRTQTLTKVATSAGIIATWTIVIIYVLAELGFEIAPLLAGVGIVGLAIGFGAQNLVRDVVTGFFILFEDQYGIGDIVEIEGAAGKVEQLTLRITGLRALDGTLHYIANGSITQVANRTKGWSKAIVDVGVAYKENVERVRQVLDSIMQEAKEDPELGRKLLDAPQVLGVEALGEYEVLLRVTAETKPGKQWEVARELRQRIKKRFDAEGIEIPFPYRVMVSGDDTKGGSAAAAD